MQTKDAIRKTTDELVRVRYIDSHPAEDARYKIVDSGEIVFAHELNFDPFAIFARQSNEPRLTQKQNSTVD